MACTCHDEPVDSCLVHGVAVTAASLGLATLPTAGERERTCAHGTLPGMVELRAAPPTLPHASHVTVRGSIRLYKSRRPLCDSP